MALYQIASTIGCTVEELEKKLSFREFTEWIAFFKLRAEAIREASSSSRSK